MNGVRRFLICVIGVASVFAPTIAGACQVYNEVDFRNLQFADVIFEGEILSYEKVMHDPDARARYGLIEIRVIKTISGEHRESWKMAWENSTFALPDDWDEDRNLIIAGLWADKSDGIHLSWYGASIDMRPDLLNVLQAACSAPFFLPNNNETRARIKRALNNAATQK